MIKFIKSLKKNYPDWDSFMSTVNFYRFNPHSTPGIAQLLCKLGRHDYEAVEVDRVHYSVILECFYCCHRKGSGLRH